MSGTGGAYTCPDCGNGVVWSEVDPGCSTKKCVELRSLRSRLALSDKVAEVAKGYARARGEERKPGGIAEGVGA